MTHAMHGRTLRYIISSRVQARQLALEQSLMETQHLHDQASSQLKLQKDLNQSLTAENQRLHIQCLELTEKRSSVAAGGA